jgi:Fe-S cluster assembly protein SufD
MTQALPNKRDEAWRYSDFKALEAAYALPPRLDARGYALAPGENRTAHEVLDGGGWLKRVCDIKLAEGAALTLIVEQMSDADAVVTASFAATLASKATLTLVVLNQGGRLGRIEVTATLQGADGLFDFSAVQLGNDSQTLEIVAKVDHAAANAVSSQTVKTVLTGKATGSYLGKILVREGAQQTDAEQSSKALLLARTATVNTKPELEIYADDVKCAHGATVGELDKNALFYLQSRGLDPAEARALLTEAFVADVIDAVADEAIRSALDAQASAKLHAMVRGQ